jgi:hypothetical protein
VQVIAEDLRQPFITQTFVFAAFLDMLYDSDVLAPAPPDSLTPSQLDFGVHFAQPDFNNSAAVGTAARDGIVDEFGSLLNQSIAESENVDNPNLMATVFFDVVGTGSTRVVGDPADASPFQDTLLFRRDAPVQVSQIRYDVLNITVAGEPESLHNTDLPGDVNDDGLVSAIDALLVINQLGRQSEAEGEFASTANRKFYDVSGDGRTTSLDALIVINTLARQLDAESEAVVGNSSQSTSLPGGDMNGDSDAVFADLSDGELIGDTGGQAQRVAAATISPLEIGGSQDDDDDDGTLGLLADDVNGLWS